MSLQNGEKHAAFLINGFDYWKLVKLRDKCADAIKNIEGAKMDFYPENGGWTLQINGKTEQAVKDAETIIRLNKFTY